jgi:transcriptional regulator with XRE-family HTH domain
MKLKRFKKEINWALAKRNSTLAVQLRHARESAHLTQAQVGQGFGRDQTFIAKLESGMRRISFVEAEKLSIIYGQRLSQFCEDIQPVRRYPPSQHR